MVAPRTVLRQRKPLPPASVSQNRTASLNHKGAQADGQRPTANDRRPTIDGQRPTANDRRPTTNQPRVSSCASCVHRLFLVTMFLLWRMNEDARIFRPTGRPHREIRPALPSLL